MSIPRHQTASPPEAVAALTVAAILEDPVDLPVLTSLGVTGPELDALFDEGALIQESPVTARLNPGIDRDEALRTLSWSARRRLHERAAETLASRPGRQEEAARHFLAACRYAEARALMVREAERAAESQEFDRATTLLRQALDLWPADENPAERTGVLELFVRSARNCGREDLARECLTGMLESAEKMEPAAAIEVHHQLADLALLQQDLPRARSHLEAAARLAECSGQPEEAARRLFAFAEFLSYQSRTREALDALHRARQCASSPLQPALLSELLGFEGLLRAMLGHAKEAHDLVEQSLALAIEHNLPHQVAMAYRRAANIREYVSDYPGEREAHLQALNMCRKSGTTEVEHGCLMCLSYVFFRTGEWKRALQTASDVIRRREMSPGRQAGARGVRAMIAAFRGEIRQAISGIDEAITTLRRYGILTLEFHLLWARGYACESNGDPAQAATAYSRILDIWADTEDCHYVVSGALGAALFFGRTADRRQVARVTDLLNAVVAANDNEESRAARFAALAEVSALGGDTASAIQHLSAARDTYERLGTPVELVLIHLRLCELLIAAGREKDAAAERESGSAIARKLGMRTALTRFQPEPSASPAASGRGTAGNGLTARQRDILHLLAAGLTNKEAASRLSLSPRTVEMHVAGLLDRLNCRTRAAAVRHAVELGLLPSLPQQQP